jgi:hypothetical protein
MDIAHAHGLKLIVAPALNLTTVRPGSPGPRWRQFLGQGLAGALARVCDVIELQAQSLERDTGTYRRSSGPQPGRPAEPIRGSPCWPGCPRTRPARR